MDMNTTQTTYQRGSAPASSAHRTVGDITLEEWKEILEPTISDLEIAGEMLLAKNAGETITYQEAVRRIEQRNLSEAR